MRLETHHLYVLPGKMNFEAVKEYILHRLKNGLPQNRTYHCPEHTNDVYSAAERIAAAEGVSGHELTLLLTAALFHDSGFIIQGQDHENISCDFAKEHLPLFGYNDEEINAVCGMIMATKIPQQPQNLLQCILCDADLDYLGRNDFYEIGGTLAMELKVHAGINTERQWDELQVKFLETHHYWTDTAIGTRKAQKDVHLKELKNKLHLPSA